MLEDLLIPRHPDDDCHYSQKEVLRHAPNIVERNRVAQLLRWGNATYCYYHYNQVEVTEADYLEWLEGLPEEAQASMRALGFEEMRQSLPLRWFVLEKNDVGLSNFLRTVLSATDWQAYQQANSAALNAWLPPLT